MTITLVTGANKGLGRETARRLISAGHTVYIGARDLARGQEAAGALGGRFVHLDVTDDDSIDAAAAQIRSDHGHLDVLVNNAGISGGFKPVADVCAADLLRVYDTNVFGVVRVVRAMLALLEAAAAPVIVNVSSGMGSFAVTSDPARLESTLIGLPYPSSKSALNMLTTQYAKALPRFRINAVDPGYTATDFNRRRGTKPVEQGAEIIVRLATIGADGPTGTFVDEHGVVPW